MLKYDKIIKTLDTIHQTKEYLIHSYTHTIHTVDERVVRLWHIYGKEYECINI